MILVEFWLCMYLTSLPKRSIVF